MRNFILLFLSLSLAGCAGLGAKKASAEYLAKGEMYHKTGDLKKALKNLNKAVETDPYNPEAYASRGTLLYDLQEYESALSDFSIVLQFQPKRWEAYSAAGAALAAKGDYVSARENLLRSLELNPSNYAALSSLGGIYFNTGNYAASAEEYTKAINLSPSGDLYFMRGLAYLHYGKNEEARADFAAAGLTEENYPVLPADTAAN